MNHHTFGPRSATRDLTIGALIAALLAASAWISLPIGAVPFTLQVLIVLLAGLILPPMRAFLAVAVYLLLGAIGVPVFSTGQGGLGILVGPTGGYLMGFLLAAPLVALIRRASPVRFTPWMADAAGVATGLVAIYLLGWAQLSLVTGMGPVEALIAGVVPFVGIDVVKGGLAVGLGAVLRRTIDLSQ